LIIGYARVSTTERNLGLEHDDLKPAFDASVDQTDARRAVARVGPTSGQRRRPRRNFTILRHAIDSANSAEKTLIHA
jgi:hypothetical protein